MGKISLACEQCGGRVELDDTREFGSCTFCKTKILIKSDTILNEVTQNITKHIYGHEGKDVDELVADGNKLFELGDEKKANAKFKNAINVDPASWNAWFGYARTGGDSTGYLFCASAYRNAYNVATDESQVFATFSDLLEYLPDVYMEEALVKVYKTASPKKRCEMFNLVLEVIDCDESDIAMVVVDLCPEDWRAWFAQAKIRQVRVRWCDENLDSNTVEVLNVFLRAYHLAERESPEAKKVILSHLATMERDDTYKNFVQALYVQINYTKYIERNNIFEKN